MDMDREWTVVWMKGQMKRWWNTASQLLALCTSPGSAPGSLVWAQHLTQCLNTTEFQYLLKKWMTAAYKNPCISVQILSQVFLSLMIWGQRVGFRVSPGLWWRSTYIYLLGTLTVFQVNSVSSYNFPRAQLQHLFKGQPWCLPQNLNAQRPWVCSASSSGFY